MLPRGRYDRRLLVWAGALLSLIIAALLFGRYGLDDRLARDEAIYTYGGLQWAKGVPFYASIFDPKTPLSPALACLAVLGGDVVGAAGVDAIRVLFGVFACLAVVAMYALGAQLWESPLAGLVAATTLATFHGFAVDAFGGPDAKTPGIMFAIVAMLLLVRRSWFWGAIFASLAFLVWQPLFFYALVAVGFALTASEAGARRRAGLQAAAGVALPIAITVVYYAFAGALGKLVEAALVFPLTGVRRGAETLIQRIHVIIRVVHDGYGHTRILFWGGLLALVVLAAVRLVRLRGTRRAILTDPLLFVVGLTGTGLVGYSLADFQGYPDLYPLLPYAALGTGGAAAWIVARARAGRVRQVLTGLALLAVAALAVQSWRWNGADPQNDGRLNAQKAQAAAVNRLLNPGETLYALGDPTPLVLTGRRNPSRFIYLESGVAFWAVTHTPGGVAGWRARIKASNPAAIVIGGWNGRLRPRTEAWLRGQGYRPRYIGRWYVMVKPQIEARAARRDIPLTKAPTPRLAA